LPELLRRPKHLAGAVASFRHPPPAGIRPHRSRHRVRADLSSSPSVSARWRRAGNCDPFHGALGKLFSEIVENADMKPVEGVRSTGASWLSCMRFAVLPQVSAGYASYALLRFEINVREASVMGFVGAGGIGQELVVAIRKFYYSDVSAILLTIIVTVFIIDIATGWLRGRLFGGDARA
jgi:hypothetical protein